MKKPFHHRLRLIFAYLLGLSPLLVFLSLANSKAIKTDYFEGQVTPMAQMLEKFGSKLDPEATAHWYALVTKDGKVYPLIHDDGSRCFFVDKRLLNRPMRLTGRVYKDTKLLQVLNVHSYLKGKLHDLYYWCDICAIRRSENQRCECCGAQMVLKEVPVKK